jgi:hypothetical protein
MLYLEHYHHLCSLFSVLYWFFCFAGVSLAFNFGMGHESSFKQLLYPGLRSKPIALISLRTD